ncbi:MAG: AraC family transcriptional regulator [Candidatus Pseudobacter hemicellulosilyticus]|uniref:AraC family transcriptional regulator n=1 Tax=Candidatus Pseudobacter hemicellulosilyticus TaxID=3121375 RepID=A0AAJ5WZ63_9BACT|nr:MAG: AraC family transcriptional regulator [Pseudobacter sp.]
MSYREYVPCQALRPYVECYWHHIARNPEQGKDLPVQRCLPLGTVEIIVQVDNVMADIFNDHRQLWEKSNRIYLTGLYTETAIWRAQPGTLMFGIRLRPEGLMDLFRIPACEILNTVVDAEAILGIRARRMFEEMLGVQDTAALAGIAEKFLLDRLRNGKNDRNYVADACRLIRNSSDGLSVETLSETLYISKRQLQRSFKEAVGTSPKTYQRIIRFRNAYKYARNKQSGNLKWSDVCYEFGYADQAHFIRDFRSFTGDAPSAMTQDTLSFFQTLEAVSG